VTANGVDEKNQLPAPKAPSFIAIDKKTGNVKWQDNSPATDHGRSVVEPDLHRGERHAEGRQARLSSRAATAGCGPSSRDGKPIWKFDCNPKKSEYKAARPG